LILAFSNLPKPTALWRSTRPQNEILNQGIPQPVMRCVMSLSPDPYIIDTMTGSRIALVLLQAVGALSFLPYPAILAANVMQIAAEGPKGFERFTAALPYVLLCFYPGVWIGLYLWSWRAVAHGATARAFVLSGVPAVLSLAGVGWFLQWGREGRRADQARLDRIRHEVEAVNPLVWTIMRSGGPTEIPGAPLLPVDDVIAEVSRATNLNATAGEWGTPLAVALGYLGSARSRTAGPWREDRLRVTRALLARGAQLAPHERHTLLYANLLRQATADGPDSTASENPLVWRIRNREVQSRHPFTLLEDEVPLLNTPTRRYGTPLWAALSNMDEALAVNLIEAGARLSPEEARDPAGAAALKEFLGKGELWSKYYH
jgi:hypothetical protein